MAYKIMAKGKTTGNDYFKVSEEKNKRKALNMIRKLRKYDTIDKVKFNYKVEKI